MKKILTLLMSTMLLIDVATAQNDTTSVNDLLELSIEDLLSMSVSVGSKTISKIEETPGTVYLIEKKDIQNCSAQNLRDILNLFVPGLDAQPTYFKYGNSSTGIYNRGIISDFNQQVLILWNGENKFNDATFGSPHLLIEQPLDNIERIEINSSSPSPLLGGSAMITINIITIEKDLEGTNIAATTGLNEDGLAYRRVTVGFGKKIADWKIAGSVQYFDDLGFEYKGANLTNDSTANGFRNGNKGSIGINFNVQSPNEKLEFGSSYRNITKDAFVSNLSYSESSDLYKYQGTTFMNYLKYKPIEGLEISTGYSMLSFNNYFFLEQFIPVGVNQKEATPYGVEIDNNDFYIQSNYLKQFDLAGSHTMLGGVRFENEGQTDHAIFALNQSAFEDQTKFRMSNYGVNIPNNSRTISTIFAEDNWKFNDKLSALLAIRADVYNNYNDEQTSAINPRLGLVYKLTDRFLLKGLYATAVRPPSLYELQGSKFLPLLYGNSTVSLEKLQTFEFNALYTSEKLYAGLTVYRSSFNDRIAYVQSELDTTISIASNSGQTSILGIEYNLKYRVSENFSFFTNGSYIDSKDEAQGVNTPYIASLYINNGLAYNFKKFDFLATSVFRGVRELEKNILYEKPSLESSQLFLNATIRYNVNEDASIYVQGNNITDNKALIPLSDNGFVYPTNGRMIFVGINLSY